MSEQQPTEARNFDASETAHESGLGDQQTEEQNAGAESGNGWEDLTPEETAEQLRRVAEESAEQGRIEDVGKAWEMAHAAPKPDKEREHEQFARKYSPESREAGDVAREHKFMTDVLRGVMERADTQEGQDRIQEALEAQNRETDQKFQEIADKYGIEEVGDVIALGGKTLYKPVTEIEAMTEEQRARRWDLLPPSEFEKSEEYDRVDELSGREKWAAFLHDHPDADPNLTPVECMNLVKGAEAGRVKETQKQIERLTNYCEEIPDWTLEDISLELRIRKESQDFLFENGFPPEESRGEWSELATNDSTTLGDIKKFVSLEATKEINRLYLIQQERKTKVLTRLGVLPADQDKEGAEETA